MQARLRSPKDDRSIQAECNLRCVVAVSMRNVSGRQQKQTLWPNIELKREDTLASLFRPADHRGACAVSYEHSCDTRCIVTADVRGRLS